MLQIEVDPASNPSLRKPWVPECVRRILTVMWTEGVDTYATSDEYHGDLSAQVSYTWENNKVTSINITLCLWE